MGPQYTRCIGKDQFKPLDSGKIWGLIGIMAGGALLSFLTFGLSLLASAAAFLEALRYVLTWLLYGKLICLDRANPADCLCAAPDLAMTCAIGEIVDTEGVGEDKNPIEDLDDDYSINLLLLPFDIQQYVEVEYEVELQWINPEGHWTYKQGLMTKATDPSHPQSDLLRRQVADSINEPKKFGYLRTLVWTGIDNQYQPYNEVIGRDYLALPNFQAKIVAQEALWEAWWLLNFWRDPKRFNVPVLHCEFEGSRTYDVLAALENFPAPSSICKKNAVFKFFCKLISAALLPIVLAKMLWAWGHNVEGSDAPSIIGGGTIGPHDRVIVRGPFVYDSGHSGWNEIHATRTVQKVFDVPSDPVAFKTYLATWCRLTGEGSSRESFAPTSPSDDVLPPPPAPAPLPEDDWLFHPAVDGCAPALGSEPDFEPIR